MQRLGLRERLKDELSQKAYIKKIIYYLFLDEKKAEKIEHDYLEVTQYLKIRYVEEQESTPIEIENILNLELIRQASETLTQKEKDVILFAYKFDLKRKDIAKIMNITEDNVYVTIHLALKKIREKILDSEVT